MAASTRTLGPLGIGWVLVERGTPGESGVFGRFQYGLRSSRTWAALQPIPAKSEPVQTPMARLIAEVATLVASSASKVNGNSAACRRHQPYDPAALVGR